MGKNFIITEGRRKAFLSRHTKQMIKIHLYRNCKHEHKKHSTWQNSQPRSKKTAWGKCLSQTAHTKDWLPFIHQMFLPIKRTKHFKKSYKELTEKGLTYEYFHSNSKEKGKMPKKKVWYHINAKLLSWYTSMESNST